MSKSSSAYDLSTFAPRPEKKAAFRVVKNQHRAFAGAFSVRVVFAFALVMTLASLMVYNRVHLNELTREISNTNAQLAVLESESVRYASLLESNVSLRAIAQQAEEMGMIRMDAYRTVHVYLHESDQIILFGQQNSQEDESEGLFAALGGIINSAMEYITRIGT